MQEGISEEQSWGPSYSNSSGDSSPQLYFQSCVGAVTRAA